LSLSHNIVLVIFEDSRQRFWIGTYGGGLNLMDREKGTFQRFQLKNGLPSNVVYGIVEDEEGFLWISTSKGLSRFDTEKQTFRNYDVESGLQSNEFNQNAYLKSRSGYLYFGGINGFNVFRPKQIKDNPNIPEVVLTKFTIFNKLQTISPHSPLKENIAISRQIVLDYTQSVFGFEFAALNYIHSQRNQYAYKLEGFDKDWNYIGTKREATYTNLDPGTYVFRVKACNNDGVWNEKGLAIELIIKPPFWKTWWFRIMAACLFLLGIYAFYKNRVARIEEQNKKLETLVKERTQEVVLKNSALEQQTEEIMAQRDEILKKNVALEQQTEEILAQRDDILKKNLALEQQTKAITDSIRYAQTMQQAILPLEQDLKRAFNDYFVLFRPKDIVSGDFYWYSHVDRKHILAVVDCTGHGVPGAFMSLIGNTILDETVNQKKILEPSQILDTIHLNIIKALRQAESNNMDGMDLGILVIDYQGDSVLLHYAAAKRPLWYQKNGKIEAIQGDRRMIGGAKQDNPKPFQNHVVELPKGAVFYMQTDGLSDQPDAQRKNLGKGILIEFLNQNLHRPMAEQSDLLIQLLDNHKINTEQRDDITFIGIRL
jgi:serine phosphatase RsbU (regulator of sigma subunit)